ncbi:ketosteroid isomerase-like protein [Sphingobium xenophagum]|uniref:Ketosteroid isomerase-like protein n=1 Tax=Sphingobium xenophagum TaxID=121428 RepID=A0ABU1X5G1_SPHXE|nr:nuclear transport factor 2 family protein [Sphingobium xenophagum]MDR7156822.1 ketosteroid isomerase-like protein [Sphingobium xenophagum]
MLDANWAEKVLTMIAGDTDQFLQNLNDDIVLEFPYARLVNLPVRIEGIETVREYIRNVNGVLKGLTFTNIAVLPLKEEGGFILEYEGSAPEVHKYDQTYIAVMRFRDGKLSLFKEYYDSTEVARVTKLAAAAN